jgi:peptidoglycan/LPS O-acetylase OafA/YrhL
MRYKNMQLKYRKDIDGLRAIAVLAVVLFHLDFTVISGGFIGVDVFFVISGFLITGIIHRKILENNFSFLSFYQRRILRILPVFYVVVVVTLLFGAWILLPEDFENLVNSVSAASLHLSNVFFWVQANGYFSLNTDQLPFLHTWSLSVEEQFYLFWPVSLIVLTKLFGKSSLKNSKILFVISLVLLLSLVLSEIAARNEKLYAYYLIHTRVFELLMGGVLVFLPANKLTPRVNSLLAWSGISLIAASIFLLNKGANFPGLNAFIPCLGASLLIYTGQQKNFISILLSTRILVSIGLISYSLYLWHWPPIAFANYMHLELTFFQRIVLLLFLFGISYLSWKYVENPCRSLNIKFRTAMMWFFIFPLLVVLSFTYIIHFFDGIPERFSVEKQAKISFISHPFPDRKNCINEISQFQFDRYCDYGIEPSKADIFLAGDSHANAIIGAVEEMALNADKKLFASTFAGAPVLINVDSVNFSKERQRTDLRKSNHTFLEYIKNYKFEYVVLAARYPQYLNGELEHKNRLLYLSTPNRFSNGVLDNIEILEQGLRISLKTIINASSKPIIVVNVPEFPTDISRCIIFKSAEGCAMPKADVVARQTNFVVMLNKLRAEFPSLIVIDFTNILCDELYCFSSHNGRPYYFDSNHINYAAAKEMGLRYMKTNRNPFK